MSLFIFILIITYITIITLTSYLVIFLNWAPWLPHENNSISLIFCYVFGLHLFMYVGLSPSKNLGVHIGSVIWNYLDIYFILGNFEGKWDLSRIFVTNLRVIRINFRAIKKLNNEIFLFKKFFFYLKKHVNCFWFFEISILIFYSILWNE